MIQYRKKPVVIEAICWDGNIESLSAFPTKDIENVKLREGVLYIHTLEGEMKADIGDYIIKGIKGEYYPCKPDIFEATYIKEYKMEHLNNALIAFKGSTPIVFDPIKEENIDLSTLISLRDNYLHIAIQDGTIPSVGVNGIQVTDLLKYVKEVYISLNNAYPSIYNEGTIIAINQALASQESRTKDREKRGVEGQNKL